MLMILALLGCTVGPNYQRPLNPLPAQYAASETPATVANGPLVRGWWKLFQDPLLDDLVERALRNNPDILLASARIEESAALLGVASAAQTPEVALGASATRTEVSTLTATPPAAGSPPLRPDFNGFLSSSFELDFWGKLRRASEAARAQALASSYGKSVVELTLLGSLTQAYFALRSLDAQIAVTLDTLGGRGATRDIANSRFIAGSTSEIDLRQAQAGHANVMSQLADLQQQRAIVEHQLAVLTATPDLQVAPGDLRHLPLPPLPPAGLPATLLDARPDILLAEQQLIAANARIGVAKAALFPSITLTASLGRESKDLSSLFSAGSGTWGLGMGVNLPLIDAGKRQALFDQAGAQQKQALAGYQQAIQTSFREVRDALTTNTRRAEAEQALTMQMGAAERNLKLSLVRYASGYSAYLEVLDAQRVANDATLSYIRNRQSRLAASVDLFKALGGGWDQLPRP
jgi:multidrug efflux system outer membrane protein